MTTSGNRSTDGRSARALRNRRAERFWLLVMVVALVLLAVPAIASAAVAQRGSATYGTTATTSLTIDKPTGVTTGDLMIVTISKTNNRTTSPTATGWTLINGVNLGGSPQRYGAVLYRVATAADASVTDYTFALGTGTTDAVGGILAFSGVSSTTPFDVTPGTILVNGSSTTVTATGITTASADAAVVMLGMASASAPTWSGWTTTSPGALTELLDHQSTTNSVGAAWGIKAAAGATGSGTATLSSAERNGGVLVALRPALIPLTVTATGETKTYDGTTAATVTLSSTDVQPGDAVTFAYAGAAFTSATAGTGKTVNVSGISISGADAGKYGLQNTTATTTADIDPRGLTITADDQSKTYGDAKALGDTAFSTGGLVAGDSVVSVTLDSTGAAADATVAGSPYSIAASDAQGAGLDNYSIRYVDGQLTVDPKDLTITAADQSKTYGDDLDLGIAAFTVDGLVNGDEVTSVTLGSLGAVSTASVAGSPYAIAASDALGIGLGNYSISYVDGGLTVDRKDLTIVGAVAQNRVYDGTDTATVDYSGATLDGVLIPDDVAFDASSSTALFDAGNAGPAQAVTIDGVTLTGGSAGNYTLSQPAGLTADITPLGVTGSFTTGDKTYDGTTDASVRSRDVNGAVAGDEVALTGGTAAFDDKNVGADKQVALTDATLDGADAGNYTLDSVDAATAAITAKALSVAASGDSKVYDSTTDATITLDSADVVMGDDISLGYTTATFADKNVGGGVAIAVGGISVDGADAGNYDLQNTTAGTSADITPLGVTGSFTTGDKTYDGTTDAGVLSRDVNGAVVGDDVSLSGGIAAFDDHNVGAHRTVTLTGASLDGADAGNYILDSVDTATAAITAKALTVDGAIANSKVYDGTRDATAVFSGASLTGIVGTEDVSLDSSEYTAAFAAKSAGSDIAVAVDWLALGGADAGNYTLTQPVLSADITPAPLTVAATGCDKVYDGTTAAVVILHSGDILGSDAVTMQYGNAAFAVKNVGHGVTIAVGGITIGAADAGNYALQNTTATAAADITAKSLTVTAKDETKQFGQAFTFSGQEFTASGLVNGDSVASVAFACAGAAPDAAAGTYPIVPSAAVGTGLANYDVAYANGTMTVGAAPVVTYRFSAFAKPLRTQDNRKFHRGDRVLVKFTIKDSKGAKVTNLHPRIQVTAKGFKFGPKTVKYNAKRKAYAYCLKIGDSWKLRGYTVKATLTGSTAKRAVTIRVVK